MSMDGEIRGVLVEIGVFLGFGACTVMVGMGDVFFVADDPDDEDKRDTTLLLAMT